MPALKKADKVREDWLSWRNKGIGGSDARRIMSGQPAQIMQLWEEKTGRRQPDDLSGVLLVQIGVATEALNLAWFENTVGPMVTNKQEQVELPGTSFIRCTLDGRCVLPEGNAVVEAKYNTGFKDIDTLVADYYAQLQHNMLVTGDDLAALSVIFGHGRYDWRLVRKDPVYHGKLLEAEYAFWEAVKSDTPPVEGAIKGVTVQAERKAAFDMKLSNAWKAHAAAIVENEGAHKDFLRHEKKLKELVPDGAIVAFGDGVFVTVAKNGNKSVKTGDPAKAIGVAEVTIYGQDAADDL